uniref:Uncharacterized protein n=1 Tax=Oryza barthii TaxID=65489 RepID=A0A0D3FJ75_9ORYZ
MRHVPSDLLIQLRSARPRPSIPSRSPLHRSSIGRTNREAAPKSQPPHPLSPQIPNRASHPNPRRWHWVVRFTRQQCRGSSMAVAEQELGLGGGATVSWQLVGDRATHAQIHGGSGAMCRKLHLECPHLLNLAARTVLLNNIVEPTIEWCWHAKV